MTTDGILFDLDDTLLGNRIERFLPAYFTLLAEYAAELSFDGDFIRELIASTRLVITNKDPSTTNIDVLWNSLCARTGLDRDVLETFFNRFYADAYPALRRHVQARPIAPQLVRYCLERGWRVVVATNPLFQTVAIEQRLAWAGLPLNEFDFAFVTTMNNMHATKPNRAYYEEILAKTGLEASTSIMVGDNWQNDIEPAAALGFTTFYIGTNADDPTLIAGHGTLRDCFEWLKQRP